MQKTKKYLLPALLAVLICFCSGCVEYNSEWAAFKKEYENSKLAVELNEKKLIPEAKTAWRVESDHVYVIDRRKRMASQYSKVVAGIEKERNRIATEYKKADGKGRKKLESEALAAIDDAFRFALFPLWAGGDWSLGGTAEVPHEGPIACGFFLERIMTDLGFRLRSSGGYRMGHLATDEMMWSYSGRYSGNLEDWSGLESFIHKNGPGLYLVGLSGRTWGHVVFLRVPGNGKPVMYHSGYGFGKTRVRTDPAKEYVSMFLRPHLIHAARIDLNLARSWIRGNTIRPVKCKAYPSDRARRAGSLIKVQSKLKTLGYYRGKVDGVYGSRTRKAIAGFQKAKGLPVTRLPDGPTLRGLKIKSS